MLRLLALWGTRIAVSVMLAVMGGADSVSEPHALSPSVATKSRSARAVHRRPGISAIPVRP